MSTQPPSSIVSENVSSRSASAVTSPQPPQEPLAETFASRLRISYSPSPSSSNPPEDPWPPKTAFPPSYPNLFLDGDYETLGPDMSHSGKASNSQTEAQYMDEDTSSPNALDKDTFESSLDKTFLKFSERLAQNPDQVLRYEWRGSPLLYSGTDPVGKQLLEINEKTKVAAGIPRCETCGAERVFEMQLVPGAISVLEEDELNLEEGMEWGTIIVGVCERNCGETGGIVFREEWCGVQWEERA